jgi:cytochrome c553
MGAKCIFVLFWLLASVAVRDLAAAEVPDEADAAAKLLATEVCSVCHGLGGQSTFPAIPNLAAQPWPYISAKMRAFRHRAGNQPAGHVDVLGLMLIDDATDVALAHYFANQPPAAPVAGDAALVATGGKIYAQGDAAKGIAPCAACHGADASGFWIFPRLAGQHAEYVSRQLRLIQSRLRGSRLMHGMIQSMNADEIKAVAAFVQSK